MGFMDSVFGAIQKSGQELYLKIYKESADKVPDMVENLRRCRDDEMREKIARNLGNTMKSIQYVASSGRSDSSRAMRLYEDYVRRYQGIFEAFDVRYK